MSPHRIIATAFSLALVIIAAVAWVPTYRVAPVFLVPILWAGSFLRRRLCLHPFHYLLFALALALHSLGAFGFYQRAFFGLSFDIYVHFYFGFVAGLIVRRALGHTIPLRPWQIGLTTILFVMGAGAIHELGEYASTLALGEERGMLKPSTSYAFDTQRDLLNNLLGVSLALLVAEVQRAIARPRPKRVRGEADMPLAR